MAPLVKGKAEKSLYKLEAINTEINKMKDILDKVQKELVRVIKNECNYLEININLEVNTKLINSRGLEKQKSMIETLPKRIEFELNHLIFYIDFTLLAPENDGVNDIKGCMIYGVNRSTCFIKCIFPNKTDDKGTSDKVASDKVTCENCERISRCDRLEDKPLIQFSIDRQGMIQSAGEFEDSWWLEKEDDLPELHYRTMELIWPKALAWTNENLLA